MPRPRSARDVVAGLVFIAFGVAFGLGAVTYEVGTPTRMGPGFYPLGVGILLVVLGVLIALVPEAVDGDEGPVARPPWRAVVLILGAILIFGFTVRPLGLVPSVFIASALSSIASERTGPPMALLLAASLTIVSVLLFVVALRLQLQLFGPLIPFQ